MKRGIPSRENAHYWATVAFVLATLCQLGFDVPKLVGNLLGANVTAHGNESSESADHGGESEDVHGPKPTP